MTAGFELPLAAERLIPQRPPLCAIDCLTEYHGGQGVVEATLPSQGIFIRDDGTVDPMVIVEIVAQSFAAVKGYENLLEGDRVRKGYLVEIKRFEFYEPVYGGDRLFIVTNKVGETDDFTLAEGKAIRNREIIASGNLMVWVPKEV